MQLHARKLAAERSDYKVTLQEVVGRTKKTQHIKLATERPDYKMTLQEVVGQTEETQDINLLSPN